MFIPAPGIGLLFHPHRWWEPQIGAAILVGCRVAFGLGIVHWMRPVEPGKPVR